MDEPVAIRESHYSLPIYLVTDKRADVSVAVEKNLASLAMSHVVDKSPLES